MHSGEPKDHEVCAQDDTLRSFSQFRRLAPTGSAFQVTPEVADGPAQCATASPARVIDGPGHQKFLLTSIHGRGY